MLKLFKRKHFLDSTLAIAEEYGEKLLQGTITDDELGTLSDDSRFRSKSLLKTGAGNSDTAFTKEYALQDFVCLMGKFLDPGDLYRLIDRLIILEEKRLEVDTRSLYLFRTPTLAKYFLLFEASRAGFCEAAHSHLSNADEFTRKLYFPDALKAHGVYLIGEGQVTRQLDFFYHLVFTAIKDELDHDHACDLTQYQGELAQLKEIMGEGQITDGFAALRQRFVEEVEAFQNAEHRRQLGRPNPQELQTSILLLTQKIDREKTMKKAGFWRQNWLTIFGVTVIGGLVGALISAYHMLPFLQTYISAALLPFALVIGGAAAGFVISAGLLVIFSICSAIASYFSDDDDFDYEPHFRAHPPAARPGRDRGHVIDGVHYRDMKDFWAAHPERDHGHRGSHSHTGSGPGH